MRSLFNRKGFKKGLTVLAVFAFVLASALPVLAGTAFYQGKSPKYVFFFIGDGLGIPQRTAARAFTGKKLAIDSLKAQGITSTQAADRFITGSAAAATALACGMKTNINYIGVDPQFKPLKTVAEIAKEQGRKVGIVSSVSIDHATPAAFYAHVKTRKMYHEIGMALAKSGFDYFAGGGLKDPRGKKSKAPQGDALELAQKNGYKVVTDKSAFNKLKKGDGKVLAYNAWLQDGKALPYAMDRRDQDISLAEFTAKGIELLDNPKGFFMMVEGGKIDWACHANDGAASIQDTLAFDNAVKQAINFAAKHPRETVIIVTGDHECGGLTLGFAGTKYASHFEVLGAQKVSFQKFTDEILKDFRKNCGKSCSFADMKPLVTKYFGLKFKGDAKKDQLVLNPYEVKMLEEAFDRTMKDQESKSPKEYLLYGGYNPLAVQLTHILNNKAGLGWTSYKHTALPVATSAMGVGAEIFNGFYDNTDVAKKIMSLLGAEAKADYHAAGQIGLKVAAR